MYDGFTKTVYWLAKILSSTKIAINFASYCFVYLVPMKKAFFLRLFLCTVCNNNFQLFLYLFNNRSWLC